MTRWIQFSVLILFLTLLPFSSVAQQPDQPIYAQAGTYAIGIQNAVLDDESRPLGVSIWYPAETAEDAVPITYRVGLFEWGTGQAVLDAAPDLSNGPYPLVVFSHGSGASRFFYTYLVEHLASQGFVVIAADHPTNTIVDMMAGKAYENDLTGNYVYRPQDVLRLIDYAETVSQSGALAGVIDMERMAAMGHSFGGYTALAVGGAQLNFDQMARYCATTEDNSTYNICGLADHVSDAAAAMGEETPPLGAWSPIADPRIDAIVALAPWNGPILDLTNLKESTIPTLIMVGTNDQTTPPNRDANFIFSALTQAPKRLVAFENADHVIFVDECPPIAEQVNLTAYCSDPVWDMEQAHNLINHFATAFLKSELLGDEAATQALHAGVVHFEGIGYAAQNIGPAPEVLIPQVIETYPHDRNAFTQGLLLYEGTFYESTGRHGESTLRQVEVETGEVLRSVDVDDTYFAEGLERVGDKLVQLTWQAETAFVYDAETFEQVGTFSYTGEGWGLCTDGDVLYRSDGSNQLFLHDTETFEEIGQIFVTLRGELVHNINELECVDDLIYANIWQTDYIIRIEKSTGVINGVVIASDLLSPEETSSLGAGATLNGIVYDAENDMFYLTGKLWPKVFAVHFVVP